MALQDDIIDRVPDQVLVEVTNQRNPNARTGEINRTMLAQAASDVQTWFETYAEESYDSTVGIHVQVCIKAAMAIIVKHGGDVYGASKTWWEGFKDDCDRVRATRARARIEPSTNSKLTPTDENRSGRTKRPWADDTFFEGLVLRRGGTEGIDPDDYGG